MRLTFGEALRAAARARPLRAAVSDGERVLSYGQLADRCARLTAAIQGDWDLPSGAPIALLADNCLEYLEVATAVPDSGRPLATLSARMTSSELTAIHADAGVAAYIVDARGRGVLEGAGLGKTVPVAEIGEDYEAWLAAAQPSRAEPRASENDLWTLPYTSGTTGTPKGVMLAQRPRVLLALASAAVYGCFRPGARFLAVPPMCYGGGLLFPLTALLTGGLVEVARNLDIEALAHRLREEAFSGAFLVPTQLARLSEQRGGPGTGGQSPEILISSAAALSEAIRERVRARFPGSRLHDSYASTEAGIVTDLDCGEPGAPLGSVGRPLPLVEVAVTNEAGEALRTGEIGQLRSRSPFHFHGYYRRPEETAAVLKDGWIAVGDLAVQDERGYVSIAGRTREMVITGGINVYPREVEDVLMRHPGVADAAVIGVPDAEWGELVVAFIVPRADAALDAALLQQHCRQLLSTHKVPKRFVPIPQLPRNANGKVELLRLRALAADGAPESRPS